mmetsp:Transcript_14843/g.29959  ORF Transcript_14843/g.29959 Transcript_14843/m.29959 type:complete len:350 (-) Transcript_14843:552-1601(-)
MQRTANRSRSSPKSHAGRVPSIEREERERVCTDSQTRTRGEKTVPICPIFLICVTARIECMSLAFHAVSLRSPFLPCTTMTVIVCSFVPFLSQSFTRCSLTHSRTHSFIHSYTHSFIKSLLRGFIHDHFMIHPFLLIRPASFFRLLSRRSFSSGSVVFSQSEQYKKPKKPSAARQGQLHVVLSSLSLSRCRFGNGYRNSCSHDAVRQQGDSQSKQTHGSPERTKRETTERRRSAANQQKRRAALLTIPPCGHLTPSLCTLWTHDNQRSASQRKKWSPLVPTYLFPSNTPAVGTVSLKKSFACLAAATQAISTFVVISRLGVPLALTRPFETSLHSFRRRQHRVSARSAR